MELKYGENKIWLENEAGDMKAYVDFPETGTGRVNVTHTVVDPDLRGQGAAGKLMEALAGKLKEDGKKAELTCSYAVKWFAKHPEHKDLLVATEMLDRLKKFFDEEEHLSHAAHVVQFDMETLCPPKGMEAAGETAAYLTNQIFRIHRNPAFLEAASWLYEHRGELGEFDRTLAEQLHREDIRIRRITPEQDREFSKIYNKAYADWLRAKQKSDFAAFAPSLKAVRQVELTRIDLMDEKKEVPYDNLLDTYERGMTSEKLDEVFDKCRTRLVPLLGRIKASEKKIRTDFLTRPVDLRAQEQMARYLLETIGFDFERGAFSTTEHPFTDSMGPDDERVTTHYYENMFLSSMYSSIHEGGHALFDQNQPKENWIHHIYEGKTMGQHESVSRFYENVIGRSEAFIHLIYPKVKELFPDAVADVTERELYEAVNIVRPSLIRTEADEFTYVFHIMIRYEIEKAIVAGKVEIDDLPKIWNEKYEEYLGIRPASDAEGVLQDVHWTSGFGYFPTYALGCMYNAMYYARMQEEIDVDAAVRKGDFTVINDWMAEHVWKKADRLSPGEWILDITGRELTPDDFLDYLEEKYSKIYDI